jgi:tocopherol O-methyltransferase
MSDEARIQLHQRINDYFTQMDKAFFTRGDRRILSMHAGFSDENVQELVESLDYMNHNLAERVGLRQGDCVLDAGCGVGGSAIWLAKERKARVTGINIVESHIELAANYALEEGVGQDVKFCVADFTQTAFKDNSFDVVWAIESSCYALNKRDFIQEAWRVLKPGGRIIVADGFQNFIDNSPNEAALLNSWTSAWAVPGLVTPEQLFCALREVGFTQIRFEDISRNVMPYAIHYFQKAIFDYAKERNIADLNTITFAELDAIHTPRDLLDSLAEKLWLYGVFMGIKPESLDTI